MSLVSGQFDQISVAVRRLVARNPGYMTGPGTNTYLLGTDRCIVIDPGPEDPLHIEQILTQTAGRIAAVLATHTHPDHSPAAAALARASGAAIMGRPPPVHGRQDKGFAPTRVLDDGEVLDVDGMRLRVLHTPGHASNHLCFLLEEQQLLFTGDHMMQGSTVVIVPPDGNMRQYLDSLERVKREAVRCIAPGHGELIQDAMDEVDRLIAHRLRREAKVLSRLQHAGRARLDELLPDVYDDVDARLHPVAIFSLRAHLLKLEEDGLIHRDSPHDEAHWFAAQAD